MSQLKLGALTLTDPTSGPAPTGWLNRLMLHFINDPRDLAFTRLSLFFSLTVVPAGIALFVVNVFPWYVAAGYWAFVAWMLGPYILMLHNTSHRRLFKRSYDFFNHYIPWVLGPFFGETPDTYFAHHVGMHHPENNLSTDLSTTLPYQRDSFIDFMRYFLRFFFAGLIELNWYFFKRKRFGLMRQAIVGELGFYVVAASLFDWRPWPTTVVLLVPFVFTRFMMMAGNWGQHAFVDSKSPENCYRNSITCVNGLYNRRCFNDGYHIGHHVKATRHWTEMPQDLADHVETYAKEGAIVFHGVDFFMVWLFLMLKRYDWLAKHYVELDGAGRSKEQIISLLRSRLAVSALSVNASSPEPAPNL